MNISLGAIVKKTHKFEMADIKICAKILIFSCSGGYKNLKFVANCLILRWLNKLNPVFILEKKLVNFW